MSRDTGVTYVRALTDVEQGLTVPVIKTQYQSLASRSRGVSIGLLHVLIVDDGGSEVCIDGTNDELDLWSPIVSRQTLIKL